MIRTKLVILKDKQLFESKEGSLRLIGKPLSIAQKLKDEGFVLLHIVDTDALRGNTTNFDVYDKLTYIMNAQVECAPTFHLIEKLVTVKVRVIIALPTLVDLKQLENKKRLLVGKIDAAYTGDFNLVHDLIIENPSLLLIKKYKKEGRRIFIYKKDFTKEMEKFIFGIIE